MIEDFAILFAGAHLASAHAVAANRVALLHPIDDIKIVNVLFNDVIAAKPDKVVPVAHLVFHFGHAREPFADPHAAIVPITTSCDNVTDGSVMQTLDRFNIASLV